MMRENWKRQTFWSLPVFTGDVSGVCSALYELGGMVVMHDPSGCNSTYNTHDEIRWMDMESLIFLSGLRDIDAITGNDQKLIDDIAESAALYHPRFIAIANSPVPWLIGTDFRAVCSKVTRMTGIPAFHVETNAMHDYTYGAGQAFLELAKMLWEESGSPKEDPVGLKEDPAGPAEDAGLAEDVCPAEGSGDGSRRIRVNILGATPLDFTVREQIWTLKKILADNGFETVSVWGMGDGLEALRRAPVADVNLVISSAGIYAARFMKEKYNIPFAAGIPVGAFRDTLLGALAEAAKTGQDQVPYLEVLGEMGGSSTRAVCGEPVTMGSVAADMALRELAGCDIVCLTETWEGLISEADHRPQGEEEIRQVLAGYQDVTADPMLRIACGQGTEFHELPHFAYSGRLYLNQIKPLIG